MDDKNTSAEISSYQNSSEVLHHTCDENDKKLNKEEEAYVTPINSINATDDISMNYDDNFTHKYYVIFYHQRIMMMYILHHNMIQQNKDFVVIKTLFWIYY